MLTRPAPADPITTDLLRLRASVGSDVGDLSRLSPRVRLALVVATATGAPVIEALDGAAAAEDDQRRAARAVAVASAQTRAVAGGLIVAPALLVPALGRIVGADLVGFYTSPIGIAVGGIAGLLLAVGVLVIVGLVRRVGRPRPKRRSRAGWLVGAVVVAMIAATVVHRLAAPVAALLVLFAGSRRAADDDPVGVEEAVDLTATAMAGGVPPGEALRVVAAHLPHLAGALRRIAFELDLGAAEPPIPTTPGRVASPHSSPPGGHHLARLRAVLEASRDVGAPTVPTLRRLARDLRADDLARVLAAAERLPAQLTFPTALCLLPATVLLVGAPIVHTGLLAAGA